LEKAQKGYETLPHIFTILDLETFRKNIKNTILAKLFSVLKHLAHISQNMYSAIRNLSCIYGNKEFHRKKCESKLNSVGWWLCMAGKPKVSLKIQWIKWHETHSCRWRFSGANDM